MQCNRITLSFEVNESLDMLRACGDIARGVQETVNVQNVKKISKLTLVSLR